MSRTSSILMIAAALSLIGVFFFPIWQITLEAPQFPEPLRLQISVNEIGGEDEFILQNINILNHYIGMKEIEPESIPELKIMPYVIFGIGFLALLTAVVRRKWLIAVWLGVFILIGILGMYDFYLWEYDYGHDLDPKAAIKIEGQAYQPPLIGSKMLLNFRATSYPYTGAIFLLGSILFGFLAFVKEFFLGKKRRSQELRHSTA